jgi:hypothetical protein
VVFAQLPVQPDTLLADTADALFTETASPPPQAVAVKAAAMANEKIRARANVPRSVSLSLIQALLLSLQLCVLTARV